MFEERKLDSFRAYCELINEALKQVATGQTLVEVARKTIREELRAT